MKPAETASIDAESVADAVLRLLDQELPQMWATVSRRALRNLVVVEVQKRAAPLQARVELLTALNEASDSNMLHKRIADLEEQLVRTEPPGPARLNKTA